MIGGQNDVSSFSVGVVSIIVITYNSGKFVTDTLESAKKQTYQPIELIISDDSSTDDTVAVCEEWLVHNADRFVRCEIVKSPQNTGIAPNCNRGVLASRGEWIKLIAGDDALESDIIEQYLHYAQLNLDAKVLHSNVAFYEGHFEPRCFSGIKKRGYLKINAPGTTPDEQYQILLRSGPIYAATSIIHRSVFAQVGLYDESAPFWEDTPMWLKITAKGIKLHYLDIVGAKYRQHEHSVQISQKNKNIFSRFDLSRDRYYYNHYLYELPIAERILMYLLLKRNFLIYKLSNNRKNLFYSSIIVITSKIIRTLQSFLFKTI